jgi:hypothetical protein
VLESPDQQERKEQQVVQGQQDQQEQPVRKEQQERQEVWVQLDLLELLVRKERLEVQERQVQQELQVRKDPLAQLDRPAVPARKGQQVRPVE